MPVQIPNHAHCAICTRAIAFGDKTCSKECEEKYEDLQKRRKRTVWIMYGLAGATLLYMLYAIRTGTF